MKPPRYNPNPLAPVPALVGADTPEIVASVNPEVRSAILSVEYIGAEMAKAWTRTDINGSKTHIPTLDEHWLWQPGEVCAVTGWPGMGKSLAEIHKMVVKAVYDDWKFGLFVPENMPVHKVGSIIVQIYLGCTVNIKFRSVSKAEYDAAVDWMLSHFFIIDPRIACTLKTLLPAVKEAKKFGIKYWLLDPFNDLESKLGDYSGMMSEQLKAQLKLILDFSKDENLGTIICVHPAGEARNAKTLELKIPDQYSMEGGRMWPNRMDSICVWHRPLADEDPTDQCVDFYVKKMRNEPESGFKTPKGGVRLEFQRSKFRYKDPLLGTSPLDPMCIERYHKTGTNLPPPVVASTAPPYRPNDIRPSTRSLFDDDAPKS